MGNIVCKKCGIEYSYYTKQGFVGYSRHSCRIGTDEEKLLKPVGNYRHHWVKKLFCFKLY